VNPAPSPESSGLSADTIRVIVRITLFTMVGWLVWRLLPLAMPPEISGLVVAALSSFAAGGLANGLRRGSGDLPDRAGNAHGG
jgi:hypothetical protein